MARHYLAIYWNERKINCRQAIDNILLLTRVLRQWNDQLKNCQIEEEGKLVDIDFGDAYNFFPPLLKQSDCWYFHTDGKKNTNISFDACCDCGFYASLWFDYYNSAMKATLNIGNHWITTDSGHRYGMEIPNSIIIDFPDHPDFNDFCRIKDLVIRLVEKWAPVIGRVTTYDFSDKVRQLISSESRNSTKLKTIIGWMNYFTNKKIKDIFDGIVIMEDVGEGFLTYLGNEIPTEQSEKEIATAKKLQELLLANGLDDWRLQ